MGLTERITSSGTSTSRTSSGSAGSAVPGVYTTAVSAAPQRTASSSSFTPSPRNSPVSCRWERDAASLRICAIRGFARLVIRSAMERPSLSHRFLFQLCQICQRIYAGGEIPYLFAWGDGFGISFII